MDRHGLESEVMSTFASQVLRPMIYHGLHDQCPTIGREFVEGNQCVYDWNGEICGADNRLERASAEMAVNERSGHEPSFNLRRL